MNLLRAIRKILRWSIGLFFASSLLAVIVYKWVPVPVTPLMLIRCCQQMSKGEKIRLKFHWVKLDEEITPELALAVVASEDQKFLSHNGLSGFLDLSTT